MSTSSGPGIVSSVAWWGGGIISIRASAPSVVGSGSSSSAGSGARPFFPEVEGLRGLAAGIVATYHWWFLAGSPSLALGPLSLASIVGRGDWGVDLFFVLSGFLLGLPWIAPLVGRRPPSFTRYARRRLLRLVPAYYASVIVLAIWTSPAVPGFGQPIVTPAVLLAHFAFAPYLAMAPSLNGVYWSLSTEMQFYVVLPLLALGFRRLGPVRAVLVCLAVALAWRAALLVVLPPGRVIGGVELNGYLNTVAIVGRLDAFAFGLVVAWAWLRYGRQASARVALALVVVGATEMVVVAAAERLGDGELWWVPYFFERSGIPLAICLVLAGAVLASSSFTQLLATAPLRFLGAISYSVYLWHLPILLWLMLRLKEVGIELGSPAGAGVAFGTIVLVSLVAYALTERPFLNDMAIGRRWVARLRQQLA